MWPALAPAHTQSVCPVHLLVSYFLLFVISLAVMLRLAQVILLPPPLSSETVASAMTLAPLHFNKSVFGW